MNYRVSTESDINKIMDIILQAKDFLKAQGVDQWNDGYPDACHIKDDIKAGDGYVLIDGQNIAGYACISFAKEQIYDELQGQWLSDKPYAVIHRMAIDSNYKGENLSGILFNLAENLCRERGIHSIKIDTGSDNKIMQHILLKNGYAFCGTIRFNNNERISFAYEKIF
ncbi:GNAT family N-acetyltransferase [Anaeropeptidivorans aminofermentans]|uniref:GNAT family N-acetyltransferase n=1 Tax=Anaeropeptidivorans aminofermentans TaxID=2934315 RepID=UPI002024FCB9|nr:GNAT family N-acetyltransferase [Anaeropeptidivorans aminofermentans]